MKEQDPDSADAVATYVFAVCRTLEAATVTGLPGLTDDAPVRKLPFGTLTAVVQHVPAADFIDEAWQERLSDRDALERCARAHHEVVSVVAAGGPTIPLPLATLYLSDESARKKLQSEADRFHAVLKRIENHAEWGVKVYAPSAPPDTARHTTRPAVSASPAAGAGLAYLDRKRGIQQRRERHQEETLRIADEVDAELQNLATAFRRLRTHGQEPAGNRRIQILNATYLVAEQRVHELGRLAETLRQRTGAQIEVSGPWVPYSFVGEV
ncbi:MULTISPECIES: GvpL/GvpF family gas vesicle protein [unclassified Streptomyces]|uniref:GvpL/GvpF family gas vesicle protein n=1 Tax=unclassified Streptomyces TaxID=2593676 RepID=UPI002DD86DAE|nr:GvpL/GvpF family gas vesicle protein [Streptomyces sp. NBC_01750]WSA98449.1 GvpL/GvpF family gas vesicle protein [Streptomyces sp. NBC_01794]WSD37015.1 GvpL/GvpF family gas vesicle protein [Streptomyces sp. NBC_01750]